MVLRILPCLTALFFAFASVTVQAQGDKTNDGIDFFHGTWAESLEKAKSQKRLIFVDAYASWCGPCKRMAAAVFPEKRAGDYFNKNFVNLKIDMEKPENEEFARKFPVSSYPTLMIIDETGKLVTREIGAKSLEALLEFGKKALSAGNKSVDFTKRYEAGERAPQFIHDYIVELNKAGKPSLKFVNEYLRGAKPTDQAITDQIVFEGAIEADSKVFERMTDNIAAYRKTYGDERVDAKVLDACESTLEKAISFKNEDLLKEAKTKYAKCSNAASAALFAKRADTDYYVQTKNVKAYLDLLAPQEKELLKAEKYPALESMSIDIVKVFASEVTALQYAEDIMKKVIKGENDPKYYFTLIDIQAKRLNFKEALKNAEKGKLLAEKSKSTDLVNKFDFYISSLKDRI
jgi:thiol-disulfide isomerase/thioredoxin